MFYKKYISEQTNAAPLAVFRVLFGIMMFLSIVRFWYNGWIEKLYLEPSFHFSYYGFEWIKPIGNFTYLLFTLCGIAALCIAIGFKYRISIVLFFITFTYIELMDKTTYLNHYYFVSVVSFILIFLPANARFSLDNIISGKEYQKIPRWTIDSIKLILSIVYVYAGLAKLNSEWMLRAMPLKIWLPSKYDLPFIGNTFMQQKWFHYAMSWSGAIYDLIIPFALLYGRTRKVAFFFVVFFHVFTRILFPIGMFPYIMIVGALIFFNATELKPITDIVSRIYKFTSRKILRMIPYPDAVYRRINVGVVSLFLLIQLLFPWRYLCYPDELFWTEEGYRFSWRVMLMEKAGAANFKIVNGKTGDFFYVNNADFLTAFQEKQMSFQPDFILEYAHYLGDHFTSQKHKNVEVYVDCYVALNGRLSKRYIDPTVDLYKQKESLKHKNWIIPFDHDIKIKGL